MRVYKGCISRHIHRLLLTQKRGNGLECHPEIYVFAVAYASLYASAVVCRRGNMSVVGTESVVLPAAMRRHTTETLAILETLCGIDAEHSGTELGVELAEFGFAQTCRTAFYHARYDAAHGVARSLHVVDEPLHEHRLLRIGAAHDVTLGFIEVVMRVVVLQSG